MAACALSVSGFLRTAPMVSMRILPPSSGGMGRRFMKPSDIDIAAMSATKSRRLVLAACDAMTEMPTTEVELLSTSMVVGISVMASQAANTSLLDFVALMAAISMSLGFMNLLPIPPLDGGKILIETIGAIRRKPLTLKAQAAIGYVGLAFFLFIFFVVIRNDVLRFVVG